MVRKSIVYLVTFVASGLFFVNVYTSIVDAPSWGHNIPSSIHTARGYFESGNPGTFFRLFSPANQILSFLAIVFCWKLNGKIRVYSILAFSIAVAIDIFTFTYFYPRNEIMFVNPIDGNVDAIQAAWSTWSAMNWVRSALILVNVVFDFTTLTLLLQKDK